MQHTSITTAEAARAAGVSEGTIRRWLDAGVLTHEPTPLGRLIDPASLGRIIAEREAAQREKLGRRPVLAGGTDE